MNCFLEQNYEYSQDYANAGHGRMCVVILNLMI